MAQATFPSWPAPLGLLFPERAPEMSSLPALAMYAAMGIAQSGMRETSTLAFVWIAVHLVVAILILGGLLPIVFIIGEVSDEKEDGGHCQRYFQPIHYNRHPGRRDRLFDVRGCLDCGLDWCRFI